MIHRRDFIKHSAAIATVASAGIAAAETSNRVDFVVVDEHFEDSVSFANVLIAGGAKAYSVHEDLGRLWFGELGRRFIAGASIAGLTMHSELFICSSFASQRGARLRFEGEHDCRGGNALTHVLRLQSSQPNICTMLADADARWPAALATNLPAASMRDEPFRRDRIATTTVRSATHPGSLFSWLIA